MLHAELHDVTISHPACTAMEAWIDSTWRISSRLAAWLAVPKEADIQHQQPELCCCSPVCVYVGQRIGQSTVRGAQFKFVQLTC